MTLPGIKGYLTALAAVLVCACIVHAEPQPQPTPMPNSYVHDFAGVLKPDQVATLQAKTREMKATYKTEIALVTVASLNGEDSFDYSMRMARAWGIGAKDEESRGMLILIAIQDRKTSFRTSRHVEGEFPDGVTGSISRAMGVYFKQGNYGGGLLVGMDLVLAREKEVFEAPAVAVAPTSSNSSGLEWLIFAIVATAAGIIAIVLYRIRHPLGRKLREPQEPRPFTPSYPPRVQPPEPRAEPSPRRSREARPRRTSPRSTYTPAPEPSTPSYYEPSHSSSSSDSSSSSSCDSGGSSYGGSSDFGGGGSDSSW